MSRMDESFARIARVRATVSVEDRVMAQAREAARRRPERVAVPWRRWLAVAGAAAAASGVEMLVDVRTAWSALQAIGLPSAGRVAGKLLVAVVDVSRVFGHVFAATGREVSSVTASAPALLAVALSVSLAAFWMSVRPAEPRTARGSR